MLGEKKKNTLQFLREIKTTYLLFTVEVQL